jgi:hypothetical protein
LQNHPNLVVLEQPADLTKVLPTVDWVLCHGGVGTINQALAHGKPLLMVPIFLEQKYNAQKLQALGLGCLADLRGPLPVSKVWPNMFKQLSTLTQACGVFAKAHPPGRLDEVVDDLIKWSTIKPVAVQAAAIHTRSRNAQKIHFAKLPVIFLSYDEPNAALHFESLQRLVPQAQHVQGIKGFDAAHRAAAEAAQAERFITVDADTQVRPEFFKTRLLVPPHFRHCTWSWTSLQSVNGLCYGNGGLKVWHQDMLATMLSHERASGILAYDFCHHAAYSQFNHCFSSTHPNGSPYQAFRAGLREAVKLGRDLHGKAFAAATLGAMRHFLQIQRLLVWLSVGSDAPYGDWMVLGARWGFLLNMDPAFDATQISDFAWLENYWQSQCAHLELNNDLLKKAVLDAGNRIRCEHQCSWLEEFSAERSKAYKTELAQNRQTTALFDTRDLGL